jgi:hypothetical protein
MCSEEYTASKMWVEDAYGRDGLPMVEAAMWIGAEFADQYDLVALESKDLEHAGLALRVHWLWLSRPDDYESTAWSNLDLQFSAEEQDLFNTSTTIVTPHFL